MCNQNHYSKKAEDESLNIIKRIRKPQVFLVVLCLFLPIWAVAVLPPAWMQTTRESEERPPEFPAPLSSEDEAAEKKALENLFRINSEIELARNKSALLKQQITEIEGKIREQEVALDMLELEIDGYLGDLKDLLVAQQKLGAGNGVQLLLESRSLADYLQRLSYVSELSRAYRGTVESLERKEREAESLRAEWIASKERVRSEREEVLRLLQNLEVSKEELEEYLAGFAESREAYENHLAEIQKRWNALKPLFNDTVSAFIRIIESGGLAQDTVDLQFPLFGGPTAIIREGKFNEIIRQRSELPQLIFGFLDGEMSLEFPSYDVRLIGSFQIVEKKKLEFQVKSGEFYGIPMSDDAMEDLFLKQSFRFDLSSLIQKNELNSIQHKKGKIEIRVTIRF